MFTIVCLGDSITCNENSPSYVNYWQELLDKKYGPGKIKVISAGVNGETAQDGYYRLQPDVISHQPNLVTIMFGHNDVFNQVGSKNYQHYLENSLKVLISAGFKQIWLLSPNQVLGLTKTKLYPPYLKKLRQLATDHQVDFINIWSEAFKKQDLSQIYTYRFDYAGLSGIDYLHPNEKGHRLIAKFLTQHFSNHLKR